MKLDINSPAVNNTEISQKFCDNLGFSVVMQKDEKTGSFKCLSSSLCGKGEKCDQSP